MRSPSKNTALSERLIKIINKIADDGQGSIDDVEFDLRHEKIDYDQWNVLYILEDVLHLPNEFCDGDIYNQHALWFPWFGQFDAKALRTKTSKLNIKKTEKLLNEIAMTQPANVSDQNLTERLIALLTPKYFVESGDKITICGVDDHPVGSDHLHEHDRVIKKVSIKLSKRDGTIIDIEPPYDLIGHHDIVNPAQEATDPFGSILFRIVRFHNLKQATQLKKFKRNDSEVSTASAIAYILYDLIEPAWDGSDDKSEASSEEIEDAEDTLRIVNEAVLLGYLWAKIEFEANLKPLADIAKQQKQTSRDAGKKSGEIRRKNAEQGWVKIAKILAIKIREKQPELSQDDLAFEIGVLWTSDIEQPGTPRIKQLIGEMEKSGQLPKRVAKPKAKRKRIRL